MDRIIEQKTWLRRYWIHLVVASALLGIVVFFLFNDPSNKMKVDRLSLTLGKVEQAPFSDYIAMQGRVKPGHIVQIPALEGGVVQEILIPEGAMVKEGDIILVLQNQNLNQQILDCEAQLAEKVNFLRNTQIAMEQEKLSLQQDWLTVRAEVVRKERAHRLNKSLYEEGLGSQEQYLQAEEDLHLAQGKLALIESRIHQDSLYRSIQMAQMEESLQNMQLNLSIVRRRLDNLKIRAPRNGQLGQLGLTGGATIHVGQNITSGMCIGQINILDKYCIEADIDEHYIDRVSVGLQGRFERQQQPYTVEVSKVFPEVRNGAFRCNLVFRNECPENIRVGQTYYIHLELGESTEAVILPRGSFFSSTGGRWVYVLNEEGTEAVRRQVKIGRKNPKYFEVLEGLAPGERVVISSYELLGEKDKLIIR